MNGIIELPFALPTAVAGITLTHLTTTNGWIGKLFYESFGIEIAYMRIGITAVLVCMAVIILILRSVLESNMDKR